MVKTPHSNAQGASSNPGWGTKPTCYEVWPKSKNKVKNKNKDMKVNSKKGTTGKRICRYRDYS